MKIYSFWDIVFDIGTKSGVVTMVTPMAPRLVLICAIGFSRGVDDTWWFFFKYYRMLMCSLIHMEQSNMLKDLLHDIFVLQFNSHFQEVVWLSNHKFCLTVSKMYIFWTSFIFVNKITTHSRVLIVTHFQILLRISNIKYFS